MSTVDSPCISVCQLDTEQQYCTGCGRLTDEIARWGQADFDDKQQIVALAAARLSSARETEIQNCSTSTKGNRKR